jgi:hypothetical protein
MDTIGAEHLPGRTILEIGPKDAVPLAPLFLGAGAARYIGLDRFPGDIGGSDASALCDATLANAPSPIIAGLRALGCDGPRSSVRLLQRPDRVNLIDAAIDGEVPACARGVDYIVSFNVCKHVTNLELAFRNMSALLAPRRPHDSPHRLRPSRRLAAVRESARLPDRRRTAPGHKTANERLGSGAF